MADSVLVTTQKETRLVSVGTQGPVGPRGLTGDKGDKGDTGAQGPQGIQGPQGETGPTGPIGPQGIQGLKGNKGDTGPQGVQGPVGATGPQGIQGIQGPKGDTGLTGPQGIQGPQGLKGDTGSQGPQGLTGPKGDTGATGAQGIQGVAGPAGVNPRGSWVSGTTYAINDLATDGGSTWRRKVSGAGSIAPGSDTTNWELFAQKGTDGAGSVISVAGKSGVVTLVKADVGLGSVDNTADTSKAVLSATRLTTARTIAGVSFDGSANINIPFAGLSTKPTTVAGYGINDAQATLVSGTNIKTVNGTSLLGAGNVDMGGSVNGLLKCNGAGIYSAAGAGTDYVLPAGNVATASKLATARTIAGVNFDGSASISIPYSGLTGLPTLGTSASKDVAAGGDATTAQVVLGNDSRLSNARTPSAHVHAIADVTGLQSALDGKAASLVSGTTIKTINENSLVGSGNISVGDVTSAGSQTLSNKTLNGFTVSSPIVLNTTPGILGQVLVSQGAGTAPAWVSVAISDGEFFSAF